MPLLTTSTASSDWRIDGMSERTSKATSAVRKAWKNERILVGEGKGTRDWTPEQQNDILTDGMTTEEKIKKVHDYIIDSTKYDTLKTDNIHDETYKSNTAYGVLIEGYGICSGYADTMAIFLNELGIDNYKISNDTHIWNLIYINGIWAHLDSTWDDPISDINLNRDTYFLISYDDLLKLNDDTHSFNKSIYTEAY